MRIACVVLVLLSSCGGKPSSTVSGPPAKGPPLPEPAGAPHADALAPGEAVDPGAALIEREREVWALEGLLVAEAEAALRSDGAVKALGDRGKLAYSHAAEKRARAFLREHRSAATRQAATAFVARLNHPSRELLARAGKDLGLSAEDVFMDYLTYDGLLDLAIMRYGYRHWKAGRYQGESKTLADAFFAATGEAPSARLGIRVVAADERSVEISVFGARVVQRIEASSSHVTGAVGRVGEVEWTSNYERLRGAMRGLPAAASAHEQLEFDGQQYLVNYAVELDEYLTWNTVYPFATMLYLLPADEVADLYAGVAAAGGFEATAPVTGDAAGLPAKGKIGGLEVEVVSARLVPEIAGTRARRGAFLVVTVTLRSKLAEALRAPAEWFTLVLGQREHPEVGVTRPGWGPALLIDAPSGARLLGVPYTGLAAGANATLVLVYDVPAETRLGALVIGSAELGLKVSVQP